MGKVIKQGTLLAGWLQKIRQTTMWYVWNFVKPCKQWGKLPYLPINWCGGFLSTIHRLTVLEVWSKNVLGFTSKKLIFTIRLRLVAWAEVSITCGEGYQKIQNLASWFSVDTGSPSVKQNPHQHQVDLHVGDFFDWPCQIQKQKGARRLVKLGMIKIHHWFNQHLVITAWAEFPVETLCWIYIW